MNLDKTKLSKNYFLKTSFFTAVSLFSTGLLAADLYVSPTGNNTNSGTASLPFSTITKAAQVATAGTTVHVAPGTYKETVSTPKSGTAAAHIRYVSDTKGAAKIIGSGTEAMWTNNGSYVEIVGFDVTGPGRLGILNYGSYTLISGNNVHNLTVSGGCTGSGGAGIVNANYSSSDGDIIGNVVHDIGAPGSCNGVQGIYSSNLRGKISNNIVYRASAYGIHLWHAANNVLISNNTVFQNGTSGMGGGIVIGSGDSPGGIVIDNTKVINNIVYNNPGVSISEYCYSGYNCIGANNTIANNVVYGNGSGISLRVGSASGTINADPLLVNYQANGSGDYHLKSTSPAIDKGLAAGAPTNDYDGNLRPQGAGIDIGAFEYKSGATTSSANASFSTTALSFDNTNVFSKSAVKVLTVTNNGNAALVLKSLNISGDFITAGSGSCIVGNSYAAGSKCTIDLLFAPTVAGLRSGVLGVSSNSSPSALTNISLSGTGLDVVVAKPKVSLSSSSLNFGNVTLGNQSSVQLVTITNSGNAPLLLNQNFNMTGDFIFGGVGTCDSSAAYAPGSSCSVSVVFKPTAAGVRTGSVSIASNASSTPIQISLTGNAVSIVKAPIASFSTKALNFGSIKVGSKSAVQLVTITNTGNAPMIAPQAFIMTGTSFAFGGLGTCGVNVSYAPGQSCTASVVFKPLSRGVQSGSLSILTNASSTPVKIVLSGTGI